MDTQITRTALRMIGLAALRVRASYSSQSIKTLRAGPAVVCANHVSLLDGVIVALTSPTPLLFGVDTAFSRRSWFARCGMDLLAALGFGGVVPMDCSSPYGLRTLCKALRAGQSVMLFPEGRISATGQPGVPLPGVDWLIEKTAAPVVRVRIGGAERSRLFAKSGQTW